ncbi:hypothetical protein [Aeromonas veronii]|uniref:hypothetical protein n=2 Tax=Aeromonas veronii TaxID=654 RepID=UPI000AA4AA2F|nr:hypothetical protein [Aeromonas veronii]MBS4689882.1 hypothetical protein [Aeromonas veronii bv. veronii]
MTPTMKNLTEAQVMGFRGSMPPRTEHRYSVSVEPSAAERRAIEEYHEKRALRHELEL